MQNENFYKNVKKIGLVARLNSNLSAEIQKLEEILSKYEVKLLSLQQSEISPKFNEKIDEIFKQSDFVISLGGDGTLISLSRKAYEHNKAILGINAGKLGFLTDFNVNEAPKFFAEFFRGEFRIERPFMLDLSFEKNGKIYHKNAFNDIVFVKEQGLSMANIQVFRNEILFNQYFGDGLIVASGAGSTAYNLSANGPIIYTLAEVFVLTPVCSHSLTQRPIVLPRGFELEIKAKDCVICIDGQENFKANDFDRIKFGLSDKSVALIHPKNRDYFQILKEKLNWGN